MKKIVLLCAQGMSTGMLMNKMREYAAKIGYECTINAYSVSRAKEMASDADCILIGPQVRYPGVPVQVIDMVAYGRLDGAKVLKAAKTLMGD